MPRPEERTKAIDVLVAAPVRFQDGAKLLRFAEDPVRHCRCLPRIHPVSPAAMPQQATTWQSEQQECGAIRLPARQASASHGIGTWTAGPAMRWIRLAR
jgi:hypothetical protein